MTSCEHVEREWPQQIKPLLESVYSPLDFQLNHHCWVAVYPLYFTTCTTASHQILRVTQQLNRKLLIFLLQVWQVGMIVLSCSTLASIPGFHSSFVFSSLLLLCIGFKQPELYNTGLEFSLTINTENYGRMIHLDT